MKIVIVLFPLFAISAGRWSDWQPFGPCIYAQSRRNNDLKNVNQQEGIQTRRRFCLEENHESTSEEEQVAPGDCEENDEETQSRACKTPTTWSKFVPQGECSVTCGLGKRIMKRQCIISTDVLPDEENNEVCRLGFEEEVLQTCRKRPCPVDGSWSEWSAWGTCGSAECNFPKPSDIQGHKYSIRTCSNPTPKYEGSMCRGPFLKVGICFDPVNCPSDGVWTAWSGWSNWNCKLGTRNRTRACADPPPRNGGKKCEESAINFDDKLQNLDSFNKTCGTVPNMKDPIEEDHGEEDPVDNELDNDDNDQELDYVD